MPKQLNVSLNFQADTNQAKQQIQDLQKTLTKLIQESSSKSGQLGLNKEINEAITSANKLKLALEKATDIKTGALNLGKLSEQFKGQDLSKYGQQLASLGPTGQKAFSQMAQAISTASVPLKQSSALLTEFKTTLFNTLRWQASSTMIHAVIGAIQGAYRYSQELNESLNNIRIVTGYSADEMANFASQANKAAQALSTTTTNYTDAALIYYQQGIRDQSEIEERTNTTIKLANVSRQSAEEVSSQMTAIWNNFDDGTKSLEYYADVITALGANTASSSEEIATGMSKFAAVAETVGLSYEYAAAGLATVVAETRQSADTVGTAFRTLFSRLEGLKLGETLEDGVDLNKYSSALKTIGVDILDVTGNVKDMDIILDETAEHWDSLTQSQKIAFAETVGGVRQYTNLMALMNNWNKMQSNVEIAKESEGTLQEQQDIYAEGWEAARDRVTAVLEDIYAKIMDDDAFIALLNGLEKVVKGIDWAIDALGGFKSIIPLIINLLSSLYQTKLVDFFDHLAFNLKLRTGEMAASLLTFREQANQALMNMLPDMGTPGSSAVRDSYVNQSEAQTALVQKQQEMLANNQQMDEMTSNLLALELQVVEAKNEQLRVSAEQVQQNEDELHNMEEQLMLQADINEKAKEREMLAAIGNKKSKETQKITDEFVKVQKSTDAYKEQIKILEKNSQKMGSLIRLTQQLKQAQEKINSGESFDSKKLDDYLNKLQEINPALQEINFDDLDLSTSEGLTQALQRVKEVMVETGLESNTVREQILEFGSAFGLTEADLSAFESQAANTGRSFGDMAERSVDAGAQLEYFKQQVANATASAPTMSQGLAQMVSGITAYTMAINSVSSLGEIWSNEDANVIEKITKTVMALGFAIRGVKSITEAMNTVQTAIQASQLKSIMLNMTEAQMAEFKAATEGKELSIKQKLAIANGIVAGSTGAVVAGKTAETAAVEANTAAWYSNPILAIIAIALMAVVAVIGAVSSAMEKNTEAIAENAEKSREKLDATKEEVEANQELVDSYNELYEVYKKTGEVSNELIDVAKQIADVYGIENAALLIAQGRFDELTESIKKATLAQLDLLQAQAHAAKIDNAKEFRSEMRQGVGYVAGNTYQANLGGNTDMNSSLSGALDKLNLTTVHRQYDEDNDMNLNLITEDTNEGLKKAYEEVSQLVQTAREDAIAAGDEAYQALLNDEYYKNMVSWLEKAEEGYNNLIAVEKEALNIDVQKLIAESDKDINNIQEYDQWINELTNSLEASGYSADEAREAIKNYLATSKQFGELENLSTTLDSAAKESGIDKDTLIEYYDNLSEENKAVFFTLSFDKVKSIEELDKQKELLQARADNYDVQVKLKTVQEAQSNLKDNMSQKDYAEYETSSGINWGKDGIIEYNQFLAKSYDQQQEYLSSLRKQYFSESKDSIDALIAQSEDQISQYENQIAEASQKIIDLQNQNDFASTTEFDLFDKTAINKEAENIDDYNEQINRLKDNISDLKEQQKIDILFEVKTTMDSAQSLEDIKIAMYEFEQQGINSTQVYSAWGEYYDSLSSKLIELAGQYDTCKNELENYNNALQYGTKQQIEHAELQLESAIASAEAAKAYGIDEQYLEELTRAQAETNDELAQGEGMLRSDSEAAKDAAVRYARLNESIADLYDNYDDYVEVLDEVKQADNSLDKAMAMNSKNAANLKKSLAGLLDTSEDLIDSSLIDALDPKTFEKAAMGDADAIQEIRNAFIDARAAAADMADTPELDDFKNKLNELADGALIDINNDPFLMKLIESELAAGATADDIESMLSGMGIDADVTPFVGAMEELTSVAQGAAESTAQSGDAIVGNMSFDAEANTLTQGSVDRQEDVGFDETYTSQTREVTDQVLEDDGSTTKPVVQRVTAFTKTVTPKKTEEIAEKEQTVTGVKISNAHKSAGGTVSGSNRKSTSPASSGKSGGGGGGGGGSSKTKEVKEKKSGTDEKERYHVINQQIERQSNLLDRLSKNKDRAFGKVRQEQYKQEIKALNQLNGMYAEHMRQSSEYLKQDAAVMAKYGAEISQKDGTILNYDALVQAQVDKYNAAVDIYNASAQEDSDKDALEAAEKAYKQFTDDLKQYEETVAQHEEDVNNYIDSMIDKYDLLQAQVSDAIELRVEYDDMVIDWLDQLIERTETWNDSMFKAADSMEFLMEKTATLEDRNKTLTDGLTAAVTRWVDNYQEYDEKTGAVTWKASDNIAGGAQGLIQRLLSGNQTAEDLDALGHMPEAQKDEIIKWAQELQSNTDELIAIVDQMVEQLEKHVEDTKEEMEYQRKEIDHSLTSMNNINNIIDIVGKKTLGVTREFTKSMNNYNQQLLHTRSMASLEIWETLQDEEAQAQELYDKAIAEGNSELAEKYRKALQKIHEDVMEAEETHQQDVENELSGYTEMMQNMIEDIKNEALEMIEPLKRAKEYADRVADRYVPEYEKIYELSKLNRDINKSIDDTDNIKNKQKLRDLQKELNKLAEEGVEVSQYDIENARRKYELELARLQLDEAQNAKNTVRLSKDSEGNWSYIYTADETDVAAAEQNYEDKLYAMQQANAEYINELQDRLISCEEEYYEKLAEIMSNTELTKEQREEALAELDEFYVKEREYLGEELEKAVDNNKQLYEEDWAWYADYTKQKSGLDTDNAREMAENNIYRLGDHEKYVDEWNKTFLGMQTGYDTFDEYQNAMAISAEQATTDMENEYNDWLAAIQLALDEGKYGFDEFTKNMEDKVEETIVPKAEEAKESITNIGTEAKTVMEELVQKSKDWSDAYVTNLQTIINQNNNVMNSIREVMGELTKYDTENLIHTPDEANEDNTPEGSTSGGANNKTGKGNYTRDQYLDYTWRGNWNDRTYYIAGKKVGHYPSDYNNDARIIQELINGGNWGKNYAKGSWEVYEPESYDSVFRRWGLKTGGYTGDWPGEEGRLAMLHQKELVLNQSDTTNILNAVEIIRQVSKAIDLNAKASELAMGNITASAGGGFTNGQLEQTVTITAEFPNVTDRNEIAEALKTLVNEASQYANRKNF